MIIFGKLCQAEFYNVKLLTGVSTQGRPANVYEMQCVSSYEVHYSLDCDAFTPVTNAFVTQVFLKDIACAVSRHDM